MPLAVSLFGSLSPLHATGGFSIACFLRPTLWWCLKKHSLPESSSRPHVHLPLTLLCHMDARDTWTHVLSLPTLYVCGLMLELHWHPLRIGIGVMFRCRAIILQTSKLHSGAIAPNPHLTTRRFELLHARWEKRTNRARGHRDCEDTQRVGRCHSSKN
jgi:hypothetical protein